MRPDRIFAFPSHYCPMPKLYEYLGLVIFFYSNEHEPIHVHARHGAAESKAEFFIEEGQITEIRLSAVGHKPPLPGRDLQNFKALLGVYADEIVGKWVDYFVYHKQISPVTITRKLS